MRALIEYFDNGTSAGFRCADTLRPIGEIVAGREQLFRTPKGRMPYVDVTIRAQYAAEVRGLLLVGIYVPPGVKRVYHVDDDTYDTLVGALDAREHGHVIRHTDIGTSEPEVTEWLVLESHPGSGG